MPHAPSSSRRPAASSAALGGRGSTQQQVEAAGVGAEADLDFGADGEHIVLPQVDLFAVDGQAGLVGKADLHALNGAIHSLRPVASHANHGGSAGSSANASSAGFVQATASNGASAEDARDSAIGGRVDKQRVAGGVGGTQQQTFAGRGQGETVQLATVFRDVGISGDEVAVNGVRAGRYEFLRGAGGESIKVVARGQGGTDNGLVELVGQSAGKTSDQGVVQSGSVTAELIGERHDNGQLVRQVISCMPNLRYLDMDSCGVDDIHMAQIRDDFPSVKVVWRVWFGSNYTVRTDVTKILASIPSVGGNLLVSNTGALKYCTEVKYLDVGHNEELCDISFAAYMPDLEVAIFAMLNFTDLTPLMNCTKLEYLEIQTNKITDLSPLQNLTGLHHLNLGYNKDISDLSPLYGLTNLERLWIGKFTSIPEEQVEEMQRRVPNCVIDTEATDPHAGWRYGNERYDLLVQQFGYDTQDYAFPWKDPLFYY